MDIQSAWFAFGLTVFAGLATGVGSVTAFLTRRTNVRFLSVALGFSAGIMIYVSFVEILVRARSALEPALGGRTGSAVTALSFFGGILLIGLIDRMVPSFENPHEVHRVEEIGGRQMRQDPRLLRMGVLSALAIAIHNFPEGLATFMAALQDPALGIGIAIAVAVHNIPEGIAVAVPIYYATGSRPKGLVYSFVSGLAEPLGAALGFLLISTVFGVNDVVFGVTFAAVAGIMVFISLDELLPAAREYGEHHLSIYGLVAGMAVMAVSLQLLA